MLLLNTDGRIDRAFPMPGAPPDWLEVTANAVYAGRIGDGGLPWSTLARIDRATMEVDVMVFPTGDPEQDDDMAWLPEWRRGSRDQLLVLGQLYEGIDGGTFDASALDRILATD